MLYSRAFDKDLKTEKNGHREYDGEDEVTLVHNLTSVSVGHGIISLTAPWVAPGNTPQGQPSTAAWAVQTDSIDGVSRACWMEPAGLRQNGRYQKLIAARDADKQNAWYSDGEYF